MQVLVAESQRILKKQRVCVAHIDRQLDELLVHVEKTKQQLEERQKELCRRKSRVVKKPLGSGAGEMERRNEDTMSGNGEAHDFDTITPLSEVVQSTYDTEGSEVEEQDNETEHIVKDFINRVQYLNIKNNAASELMVIHIFLSKFSKHIDKNLCTDITKVCRTNEIDQKLVCRLVVEYLYQEGQIEAADAMCKEAGLELPHTLRECFIELHKILKAIENHDLQPALDWARKHREKLGLLDIDIEFELVRHKYVDILESSPDMMDAINYANKELSHFHQTHAEEVGMLMSCMLFKGKLDESPYKKLFNGNRWEELHDAVIRACCRLHSVPYRSYLETCLSAGVPAMPAMRKLASVMDIKLGDWASMEELPVELPVSKELRFHNVFCCPVSKEESTPENPPILLKCGHVICRSCVNRFSYNRTRRFKCPTCPVEQTEIETRQLFF